MLVSLQCCCFISVCPHHSCCTELQSRAGEPPQSSIQEHQATCVSTRMFILSVWCLTSTRGQKADIFTCHCDQVCKFLHQGCTMGLTISWMETPISSRTEYSKIFEPAQPMHCPGHLESNFSSMISSLLQGWMNYIRFLGPQTGQKGL